ncbi:MAG: 2-C-methyl-D-erythritol 4-phosphate cytidylyltransferase [Thiobacillaceae bacterium]
MTHKHYALIPAAGSGSRMGEPFPKQYFRLVGRPMIYHPVHTFCTCKTIEAVFVVLSAEDALWDTFDWSEFGQKLVVLRCGGSSRAQSVTHGLRRMQERVQGQDWVLVHDAARPGLDQVLLNKLLDELAGDAVGGLLAVPLADTLKRADHEQRAVQTEPRDCLWQAQTPQMFRHGQLLDAMERVGEQVTDEASAIERLGLRPKLVESDNRNIKLTYPRDLELVRLILENRDA